MSQKSDTARELAAIEELKKLQPGLPSMDYKSALRNTKSVAEAAEWLRVKRQSYI